MKRSLLIIVLIVCFILLASCGNRKVGIDLNQSFNKAYVNIGNEWKEFSIKSWRDFQEGDEVQIETTNGEVYLTHYSNMVLVNKK